ncbi:MAG TPA: DUF3611 family protein [Chroococcales cyanobacterium]|jgi:hypothetical protein
MLNKLNTHSLPATPQEVATALKKIGWIGFWVQLGLLVVSGGIILFALANPRLNLKVSNPMSEASLFFAVGGLLVLGLSIYWNWRYTGVAKWLKVPHLAIYPKKSDVIRLLQQGLLVNAVGTILTLLSVAASIGTLLTKSLAQVEGLAIDNASQFVAPMDMLIVQANINTIIAHFVGIVIASWLVSRISYR